MELSEAFFTNRWKLKRFLSSPCLLLCWTNLATYIYNYTPLSRHSHHCWLLAQPISQSEKPINTAFTWWAEHPSQIVSRAYFTHSEKSITRTWWAEHPSNMMSRAFLALGKQSIPHTWCAEQPSHMSVASAHLILSAGFFALKGSLGIYIFNSQISTIYHNQIAKQE